MEKDIPRRWEIILLVAVPTLAFLAWFTYVMAPWLFG